MEISPIVQDGELCSTILNINNPLILDGIGRLRYQVFVKLLAWVPGNQDTGLELDNYDYDPDAIHIGVIDRRNPNDIISYARILRETSKEGLMLTNSTFKVLLPETYSIPSDAIEVSRFCLNERFQKKKAGFQANFLIFRSVLCLMKKIKSSQLFALADDTDQRGYSHKDFLLKLFSFKIIGPPHYFQNNVATYALSLSVEDLEMDLSLRQKRRIRT